MLGKSSKWELGFVHYIKKFTISRFVISRFKCTTFFVWSMMFQKRIRPIFFRAKKMWGFIVIHHYLGQKGWKMILSSWRFFSRKIMAGLRACFTLFFLTGFFCEKLMVVHLIDIRSSGWKVFPKIGSEYFFSEGDFSLEKKRANWKIPKWQGSEIIFIWKMTTLEFQDFIVILRFLVKLLHLYLLYFRM